MIRGVFKRIPDRSRIPKSLQSLDWKPARGENWVFPQLSPILAAVAVGDWVNYYYDIQVLAIDNGEFCFMDGEPITFKKKEIDWLLPIFEDVLTPEQAAYVAKNM